MLQQLEALWTTRDKDQPFVKGILLANPDGGTVSQRNPEERWFILLGHSLFYCKTWGSQEYSGVFLTDVFSPVIARVNQKVLDTFELPETEQVRF